MPTQAKRSGSQHQERAARALVMLVLCCADCGATDLREPSADPVTDASALPSSILDRMVARCALTCPPVERLALAQHLVERGRATRLRALDAEEAARSTQDADVRARDGAEAETMRQDAAADLAHAMAMLRSITEDTTVPPPRVVESALADLLFAAVEAHERDEVAALAARIVRDAPTRPIAADAWLEIGERAFEEAALDRARDAYLTVTAVPGAPSRSVIYAKYKLAWTYFNLSDFAAATRAFREVALSADQPLMAREARHDFVRASIPLERSAAEEVAALREIASDAGDATTLAQRYEDALREVGLEPRAAAFRAAWSATEAR